MSIPHSIFAANNHYHLIDKDFYQPANAHVNAEFNTGKAIFLAAAIGQAYSFVVKGEFSMLPEYSFVQWLNSAYCGKIGYIVRANRDMVIAFRGIVKENDTHIEGDFSQTSFCTSGSIDRPLGNILTEVNRIYTEGNALRGELNSTISQLANENYAPENLYICGHSLGGALATLSALDITVINEKLKLFKNIYVYTFGSPRVGDQEFADNYNKLLPYTLRVTNIRDVVAEVPLSYPGFKSLLDSKLQSNIFKPLSEILPVSSSLNSVTLSAPKFKHVGTKYLIDDGDNDKPSMEYHHLETGYLHPLGTYFSGVGVSWEKQLDFYPPFTPKHLPVRVKGCAPDLEAI